MAMATSGSPGPLLTPSTGRRTTALRGVRKPARQGRHFNGIAVAPNGDLWLAGTTPDDLPVAGRGATWGSAIRPSGQTFVRASRSPPTATSGSPGGQSLRIYRSQDNGATWSAGSTPSGQSTVPGIAVAPNGDLWLAGHPDDVTGRRTTALRGVPRASTGPAGQTLQHGHSGRPQRRSLARRDHSGRRLPVAGQRRYVEFAITGPAGRQSSSGIAWVPDCRCRPRGRRWGGLFRLRAARARSHGRNRPP